MIGTMREWLARRRTRRMVESMAAQPCESGVGRSDRARHERPPRKWPRRPRVSANPGGGRAVLRRKSHCRNEAGEEKQVSHHWHATLQSTPFHTATAPRYALGRKCVTFASNNQWSLSCCEWLTHMSMNWKRRVAALLRLRAWTRRWSIHWSAP